MANFLVSGLINIETTLRIDRFPIQYFPVTYPFFGIKTTISGVGFNIAKAMNQLSNHVTLASLIGKDIYGSIIQAEVKKTGISDRFLVNTLEQNPQSVILYDADGKRQIHVDLKDVQEVNYPLAEFESALSACDIAILCNINFSRPFLKLSKNAGKLIATDVHAIQNLDDPYNRDFMEAADILFLSHENLTKPPIEIIHEIWQQLQTKICVIGMGKSGAILAYQPDNFIGHYPSIQIKTIVNTIGAGDALFSSFLDCYSKTKDPYLAIQRAIVFASHKIGSQGAAEGFLSAQELLDLADQFLPIHPL